jgi:hypothetical protein
MTTGQPLRYHNGRQPPLGSDAMTENELEILRLKLKLEAHQVLLRGIYTGLANSSLTGPRAYRDPFAESIQKSLFPASRRNTQT